MDSGAFDRRRAASSSAGARTNAFYSHQFQSIDGEELELSSYKQGTGV